MKKVLSAIGLVLLLQGCSDDKEYNLNKYYKDPNSAAAKLVGSMYAGVVSLHNTIEECTTARLKAEHADREINYTNSVFRCEEKQ